MPKFRIYVERNTKATTSILIEAHDADQAINEALVEANNNSEGLEWAFDEWPADIVRWEYAEPPK